VAFAGNCDRLQNYEVRYPSHALTKAVFTPAGTSGPDGPLHADTLKNSRSIAKWRNSVSCAIRALTMTRHRTMPERQHIMTRKLISSGSVFEAQIGYSRAVVDGDWVFVAGTTGFDYATMQISDDVAAQADQTFRNIDAALHQAGATMADVVCVRYILPDAALWEACWPITGRWLGDVRPAATMFVAGLQDPRMLIEIEVTARRQVG